MTRCRYRKSRRNSPAGRVVYRSNNNANANGGVSYANANNDASNTNANVGSRLNNPNGRAKACLPLNRPTLALDVSLCSEPRGMSLTKSGYGAGKVKHQVNRVGFGRETEEARPATDGTPRRDRIVPMPYMCLLRGFFVPSFESLQHPENQKYPQNTIKTSNCLNINH